jgi:hypothetical protein
LPRPFDFWIFYFGICDFLRLFLFVPIRFILTSLFCSEVLNIFFVPQTSQSMGGLTSKTSSSSGADMWGGLGSSGGGGSLFSSGAGVWSAPGADLMDSQQRTTPQLQPFLPGDLLGENM